MVEEMKAAGIASANEGKGRVFHHMDVVILELILGGNSRRFNGPCSSQNVVARTLQCFALICPPRLFGLPMTVWGK